MMQQFIIIYHDSSLNSYIPVCVVMALVLQAPLLHLSMAAVTGYQ